MIRRPALILTAATLLLHLAFASRYHLFGDELYFIVCGQHPAFGYADQPPLVPLLSAALYAVCPTAFAVRLPACAAAAALVWLTIALTRFLGGGDFAAWLAGLATGLAPILVDLTAIFTTATFEPLAWTAIATLAARAAAPEAKPRWLAGGVIAGLALQAKYAVIIWLAALAAGLLLTPQRRLLLQPKLWLGLGIAVLIAAPSLVWQSAHGWPFAALLRAARHKNLALTPIAYLARLIWGMNIMFAPVWLAGAVTPFVMPALRRYRFLAIAFIILVPVNFVLHGKDYYAAAAFPTAFALGAIPAARLLTRPWRRAAFLIPALGAAAVSLPLVLPILPPAQLTSYEARTGLAPPRQFWFESPADLPITFGFQFGWGDFAAQVAAAYDALPLAQRAQTAILVDDYAEAAALDLYDGAAGLPPALSGHNQYFFWSLRGQHPANILYVHGSRAWTNHLASPPGTSCAQTLFIGQTHARYAPAFEDGKQITFCANMRPSLAAIWPSLGFMY